MTNYKKYNDAKTKKYHTDEEYRKIRKDKALDYYYRNREKVLLRQKEYKERTMTEEERLKKEHKEKKRILGNNWYNKNKERLATERKLKPKSEEQLEKKRKQQIESYNRNRRQYIQENTCQYYCFYFKTLNEMKQFILDLFIQDKIETLEFKKDVETIYIKEFLHITRGTGLTPDKVRELAGENKYVLFTYDKKPKDNSFDPSI